MHDRPHFATFVPDLPGNKEQMYDLVKSKPSAS